MLDPESNDLWLDRGMTTVEAVSDLVRPCDTLQMGCLLAGTRINQVAHDDKECSRSVEPAQDSGYSIHLNALSWIAECGRQ